MAEERQKWFHRAGGLFGARNLKRTAMRYSDVTKESVQAALPRRKISKSGFYGTDADGGIARFRSLTANMSHQEMVDLVFAWERDRTIYILAAVVSILLIPLAGFYGYGQWQFVLGLALMFLFCITKAMQADFFSWRLRQQRMAPLREYLNNRLPRNVQIMDP